MLKNIFGSGADEEKTKVALTHLALIPDSPLEWSKNNHVELSAGVSELLSKTKDLMKWQVDKGIPTLSVLLTTRADLNHENMSEKKEDGCASLIYSSLGAFINELGNDERVVNKLVKIAVLGGWYELSNDIVEAIKGLYKREDYAGRYLFNIMVNYDGRSDITNAVNMLGRKMLFGKISPDSITKKDVEENLYSSSLERPQLMVISRRKQIHGGFMMWYLADMKLFLTDDSFISKGAIMLNDVLK